MHENLWFPRETHHHVQPTMPPDLQSMVLTSMVLVMDLMARLHYSPPATSHQLFIRLALLYRYTCNNNSWRCNGLIGLLLCVCVCVCHLQEEMRQSVAPAEPVQYYFTLAQQPGAVQVQGTQQAQQAGAQTATTIQPGQIIIAQPQQGQVLLMPRFHRVSHRVQMTHSKIQRNENTAVYEISYSCGGSNNNYNYDYNRNNKAMW